MRINGHAHIFNLQTVLTTEAVDIIIGRLERNGYPDFIVAGVKKFLLTQLGRPAYLTEEGLLREFLLAVAKTKEFKRFVDAAPVGLADVKLLGTAPEKLGVAVLQNALNQLSARFDPQDGLGRTIYDLFQTLRLAMSADIVSVADALLDPLGEEHGLIALMMDIVAKNEPASDKANFLAQIRGTGDGALARPGRIFPFIAVNPTRPDHFAFMKRALEQQGFVGVKLYPSLGYEVGTPAMGEVLQYCHDNETPIVVHATAGGFFKTPVTAQFSSPAHWEGILKKLPDLRVSFAHCGGWGGLCDKDPLQVPWWKSLLSLIETYDNVYGDLAYHVEMRKTEDDEAAYFGALKTLLTDKKIGRRIIFGTDSWLVRMAMTEQSYWKYFEDNITAAHFTKIAETNPAEFLGLPVGGDGPKPNIQRHIEWLEARASLVGAEPAAWLTKASSATFTPTRTNLRWSPNNLAHKYTYQFLRAAKLISQDLESLGFDGSAKIRVRQLTYYATKGHGNAATHTKRLQTIAADFDVFMRNGGAVYEGSFDSDSARDKLEEILDDGDRTLADLAASVDAIYLLSSEI